MAHKETLIKLEEMDYENVIKVNPTEGSEVIIDHFMFREDIISEIQVIRHKSLNVSSNDSIIVKVLMGNLILGVSVYDNDIVLEIEEGSCRTDYHIRKARNFDYPI